MSRRGACRARAAAPARRGEAEARTLMGAGPARSRRLGAGVEFASLREYRDGDDPRRIDWRASARRPDPATLFRLVVRDYVAEDPARVFVAASLGPSLLYWSKLEALLYAAGLVYEAARLLGDRVAGAVAAPWGDRVLLGGPRQQLAALVMEACRLLEEYGPAPGAPGLSRLAGLMPRRLDVAIALVDYAHDPGEFDAFSRAVAARGGQMVAALATDPAEHVLPRWLPRGAPMLLPGGPAAPAGQVFAAVEAHMAAVEALIVGRGGRPVRLEGAAGVEAAAGRLLDSYLAARARAPVARV